MPALQPPPPRSLTPNAAPRGAAAVHAVVGDTVMVRDSLPGPTHPHQPHRIFCGLARTMRDFLLPEGLALPPRRDERATEQDLCSRRITSRLTSLVRTL